MANTNEQVNIRLNVLADQGIKSIGDMKDEMRLLNQAMTEAAAKGDTLTFDKLSTSMGELKNDMIDLKDKMKYLDPGEALAGFTRLAQGAVGSFGAITGAIDLFGAKSEDVQEIQKKSMLVIQILTSLESARQLLEAKGVVAGLAGQGKRLASMAALRLGLVTETTATSGATAATLGLNAAMLANPAVLITAGVIALGAALYVLASNGEDAAQSTEDLVKSSKEYEESLASSVTAGAEALSNLESLVYGSSEYSDALGKLVTQYADYLTATEENALANADLATATDIVTEAVGRQTVALASRSLYTKSLEEQIRLEVELNAVQKELSEKGENFWGSLGLKINELSNKLSDARKETAKFKEFFDKSVAGTKGLSVKVDVKVDYAKFASDFKAAFEKAYSLETGLAKSLSQLRTSLITDEFSRRSKQIGDAYDEEVSSISKLRAENAELAKLYDAQKNNIEKQRSSLAGMSGVLIQQLALEQRKLEAMPATTAEYEAQQRLVIDATNALNENTKQLEQIKVSSQEISILQEKTNVSLATSNRLAEDRRRLSLQSLKDELNLKATTESLNAAKEITAQLERLTVETMEDGLAKTEAGIELERKQSQQKITDRLTEIDAIKNRKETTKETIAVLGKEEKKLADLRVATDAKANAEVKEAHKTLSNGELKSELKTQDEILKARQEAYEKYIELRINNAKDGSKEELELQKEAIDIAAQKEIAAQKKLLADKTINETEYQAIVAEIEESARQEEETKEREYLQKRVNIAAEYAQQAADAIIAVKEEASKREFENAQHYDDLKYAKDTKAVNDSLMTAAEKESALDKLEKKKTADDLERKRNAFKAEQKFALAQIAINTALAAIKSLASAPWPASLILMAGAIVTGGIQAAVVSSQKAPTYGLGGLIRGKKHSQGGIDANIEDGEVILNARSMSNPVLRNMASRINVAGGGVPIPAVAGSSASAGMTASINQDDMRSMITEIVGQMSSIPVVLSERDVTKTQRRVTTYESNSQIG